MIQTDIFVGINYTKEDILDALCRSLPVERCEIGEIRILKKTLKPESNIGYALSVGAQFSAEREAGLLKMRKKVRECPSYSLDVKRVSASHPVVVGAGPAGLFAALLLAEAGACPIVIERGEDVRTRERTTHRFFTERSLDTNSNVQFGEGGAGAFSDGKLKVGGMDKYKHRVLAEFVEAGAPEDIMYTVGAHLGTDKLPSLVEKIREKAISLGASFIYCARLCDLVIKNGRIVGAVYEKSGARETIETERVILATGHSAKDTFEMLLEHGVPMEAKGFGIGVRIEHPREYIDRLVYGKSELAASIGTASYHLVTHLPSGRSVYSFCMCPGGTVVAAASESGGVVTNGMSEYMRDAENSNAAYLVSVTPRDFGSSSVLAGIDFQRSIERSAFISGGGDFSAPAIRMEDFVLDNKPNVEGSVHPSYPLGVKPASPVEYLPGFICDSLRLGIRDFDKWMSGFYYPDAVITGAETRSTSPVRILRDEKYMSHSVSGLYPIGEGAGYAGGIVSSAVDGLRAAESIIFNME